MNTELAAWDKEPLTSDLHCSTAPNLMGGCDYVEIKNQCLAFAFIKPGFEEQSDKILAAIESKGLTIVYASTAFLTPDMVDSIYAESSDEHFYPAMKEYLCSKEVLALLISGKAVNTQQELNLLKKLPDGSDGILRVMFSKDPQLTEEEIELWQNQQHPQQDEITIRLTQRNVIHTSDTPGEARKSLSAVLGHKLLAHRIKGTLPQEIRCLLEEVSQ